MCIKNNNEQVCKNFMYKVGIFLDPIEQKLHIHLYAVNLNV